MFNSFRIVLLTFTAVIAWVYLFDSNEQSFISSRAPVDSNSNNPMACTTPGKLVLTFDGGPSSGTEANLYGLKSAGAKATFHIQTATLDQYASAVKKMFDDKHTVGLLFPDKIDPASLTEQKLVDTLLSESTAIYDVIGQYPKFIRFPTGTGSQGSPMVAKVLEKLGFVETPYNVDATVITTFSLRLARDQMYKSYQNAFAQTTVQTSSFIGIHRDPFATEVQTSPLDLVNITGGFPTVITQLVNQVIKPVGFSIVDINQCLGLIQSYRDKNEGYKVTTTEAPKPVTGKEFQPTGNGLSEVLNECNGPLFAFTFDQGPTFTSTSIIKAFDAVSQKASFHISTNRLGSETLVKVVQNAMQNGHLIGLRFPVCLTPSQMSNDAIVDALLSESQAFYEKFNRYPKFLRLPLPTDDRLSSIAQSLGMVVTGASFDSKDYQKLTGSQIENNLMNKIAMNPAAGLISLHQDLFAIYNDQKFVQRMIKLAQTGTGNNYTKGLTVVTLDTCVGETGGYRADNIDPRTGNSSTIKIAQLCEPVVYGSKGVSDAFSVQISAILTALSICLSVLFIKSQ